MSVRRGTEKLFRDWHDGEPHRVHRINSDWAPYYTQREGRARSIVYWSDKWVQAGDVAATYEHKFSGSAQPAHIWEAARHGDEPGARKLSLPNNDVAWLGNCLELECDDGEVWTWARGGADMVAIDRSRIAIVTKARYVPIIVTNLRVTPDGLDDKR